MYSKQSAEVGQPIKECLVINESVLYMAAVLNWPQPMFTVPFAAGPGTLR